MARLAREVYEAALATARQHARLEFPVGTSVRWFAGYRSGGAGEAMYHHGVVSEHPVDEMDGMFRCREHAGGRVVRIEFDRIEAELADYVPPKAAPPPTAGKPLRLSEAQGRVLRAIINAAGEYTYFGSGESWPTFNALVKMGLIEKIHDPTLSRLKGEDYTTRFVAVANPPPYKVG